MNRRSKILIILIYSLILVGLATRQRSLLAFAIPFVIYLAAGFFLEPQLLRLQVKRELSSNRVIQGSPVSIHLNIKNLSAPIENLVIEDIIPSELEILDGNAKILTCVKNW